MPHSILITAANEDSETILSLLSEEKVLHTPLEIYKARSDDAKISELMSSLDTFENIVYGSKGNAAFFLQQVQEHDRMESVQNSLNLTFDESAFDWLEENGIAAVHPPSGSKAIDMVELMLRLQRMGATLYPCGTHRREDFPGLLKELDIPVTELDIFDLEGPSDEALSSYQKEVAKEQPDTVIFHSRRSVNRTLAAFPNVDYESAHIISADKAITNKLKEKNISVDDEAEGSWESIAELV